MPTYDFSGEYTLRVEGKTVKAGERFTTDYYLQDETDINLVAHTPRIDPPQVKQFFSDNMVSGEAVSVNIDPYYNRITITNSNDAVIVCSVNGNTDDSFIVTNSESKVLSNVDRLIGEIGIITSATGRVDVIGDVYNF